MSDSAGATSAPAAAPPRWTILAAVFVGGALGTLLRAGLAERFPHDPWAWPWATFTANVAGAVIIGIASAWVVAREVDPRTYPLLATGICGGLTTFATLQIELVGLVEHHAWATAAGYVGASLAAGLAAVLASRALMLRLLGAGAS